MVFVEANYWRLPSRVNLYSLAHLPAHAGMTPQLLIANQTSENTKVIAVRCDAGYTHWHSEDVPFHYIPVEAEVLAVSAFAADGKGNATTIVGVAIVKPAQADTPDMFSLNVYGAATEHEPPLYNLAALSADCQSIELAFTPFELSHTKLWLGEDAGLQNVFLLTGNDNRLHIYAEDSMNKSVREMPSNLYFPELESLNTRMLHVTVKYNQNGLQRVLAAGCQDGTVLLSCARLSTVGAPPDSSNLVVRTIQFDSTITALSLFPSDMPAEDPSHLSLHLLVGSAIDPAHVYRNVIIEGFRDARLLAKSGDYDSILCVLAKDTDLDGMHELIIGTFGGQLLLYNEDASGQYHLEWQREFVHPLYALQSLDVTGDGVRELIVLSLLGVHIMQLNKDIVIKRVREALQKRLRPLPA